MEPEPAQGDQAVEAGERMPTEEHPDEGAFITEGVAWPAVRWIADDGAHVVDSTEFEVRGVGADWPEAFMAFGMAAFDLYTYLTDLVSEGRATDEERDVAALIGKKILTSTENRLRRIEIELTRRPSMDTVLNDLLATLNLRSPPVVERQQNWDPHLRMRQNSRTPLPA